MHKVFISSIRNGFDEALTGSSSWLSLPEKLTRKKVFVKANLTFPYFRPGVMTTPQALEAVLKLLLQHKCETILGEADSGGYNPFNMDEVFKQMKLPELAREYGAKLVNLSREPQKIHNFVVNGRNLSFHYAELFDQIDMTITIPVPKIHMNTGFSLAYKNQWGCLSFPGERLRLHPVFPAALVEINKICKLGMAVVDGTWGLNGSGPLAGEPVPLGWTAVSLSPGAVCNLVPRLLNLDPFSFQYFRHLHKNGLIPEMNDILCNEPWQNFISQIQFYLRRKWTDYPGYLAFHSGFFTHLAYFSRFAGLLHRILYLFRERFY